MKHFFRAALWFIMIYHGLLCLIPLALAWGPLYLAATRGEAYNWTLMLSMLVVNAIGLVVALLVYMRLSRVNKALLPRVQGSYLLLIAVAIALEFMYQPGTWPVDAASALILVLIIFASERIVKLPD